MVRSFLGSFAFGVALAATLAGQEPGPLPPAPPAAATQAPLDDTTTQALQRLATLLAEKRAQVDAARTTADTQLPRLTAELQALSWQFAGLAARENVQEFEAPQATQFDLQAELVQLLRPLLHTLKEATATPRHVSELEASIESLQARQRSAERALRHVERTRDALPVGSPARAEAEREATQRWTPTIQQLRDTILVKQAELGRLQEGRRSLPATLAAETQKFVQTSGMSIVWATLTFVAVFFGLRWLVDRLLRRRGGQGFPLRLLGVVLRLLAVLLAVAATLVVPYARDDFLLLGVGIVFVLGAGWVLLRMAPQFVEQIRLVLNIGGVREGERIVVDGIPYRVATLRFYTRLENPDLDGGVLRVPLQFLVGRRSRASGADEPWFPSRRGDVVLLTDGCGGPVLTQSPETVVVEHFGARRSYATADYLRLAPRNLSRGFTVDTTFTVATAHAAAAATTLPGVFAEALRSAAATVVAPELLTAVQVELQAATPTGLEFLATATCDGRAAPAFFALRRALQRAFVATAQQHGIALPPPLPVALRA